MMLQKASRGLPEGFSRASRGLPKGFPRASWRFGSFLYPVRSLTFLTKRKLLTYQLNMKWKNWIIRSCCLCSSFEKKILFFSGNSIPSFQSTASPTSHPVSKSKFQISKSKSWNSKSKWRLNNKLWHWSNKIGQAQWPISKHLSENHLLKMVHIL